MIFRKIQNLQNEVQETQNGQLQSIVSTRLPVDTDIILLGIELQITENCKYSISHVLHKNFFLIVTRQLISYFIFNAILFTSKLLQNFNFRCTCNDRDICVFTENKSAQMTYVFTCQERTSSNENRFLFPSSVNGR